MYAELDKTNARLDQLLMRTCAVVTATIATMAKTTTVTMMAHHVAP